MSRERTWQLSDPLTKLPALAEDIEVRLGDVCEGIVIFGGIGSGKTSGPGTAIPLAMLERGYGMLVLCAKPDEALRLQSLAEIAGRGRDVVVFGRDNGPRYNFLDDLVRGGPSSVVRGFGQIAEAALGKVERSEWTAAAEAHLRMGVAAFLAAKQKLRLPELRTFLNSLDDQRRWIQSVSHAPDEQDVGLVRRYFENEWPAMSEKTRASVMMSLNPALDPFCMGRMKELFCSDTTVRPHDLRHGKIVIVDVPVLGDEGELGRVAGVAWKYMTQRCLQNYFGVGEERAASERTRPVVIMADEAHYFATSNDAVFQSTARSARAVTMYMTQTINNFWGALGGTALAKAQVGSLLDSLQGLRIMAQTTSEETYKWFVGTLGKELQIREGRSANIGSSASGGASTSVVRDVVLENRDFQVLAKGGPMFRFCVTAIVAMAGRVFKNGRLWTQVAFPQRRASR
jgi:type IV secretory pathway TraG/TraD family ATPase VirD4